MSVAAPLVLREGDRLRLDAAVEFDPGGPGVAGADRVAGRRRVAECGDRAARRHLATTVVDWRARYDAGGINSLHDQPRSGRPAEIDEIDVVVATLADDGRPPARLGVTWTVPDLVDTRS